MSIGYIYSVGLIIVQALALFFYIYQACSGGEKAQDKFKDMIK
jgi:hypothetical protein